MATIPLIDLSTYKDDARVLHTWPPVYTPAYQRRVDLLNKLRRSPELLQALHVHYAKNPLDFILDWLCSYDPRNAGTELPTTFPFCLFPRQLDVVAMIHECVMTKESGMIKKCRDAGATI